MGTFPRFRSILETEGYWALKIQELVLPHHDLVGMPMRDRYNYILQETLCPYYHSEMDLDKRIFRVARRGDKEALLALLFTSDECKEKLSQAIRGAALGGHKSLVNTLLTVSNKGKSARKDAYIHYVAGKHLEHASDLNPSAHSSMDVEGQLLGRWCEKVDADPAHLWVYRLAAQHDHPCWDTKIPEHSRWILSKDAGYRTILAMYRKDPAATLARLLKGPGDAAFIPFLLQANATKKDALYLETVLCAVFADNDAPWSRIHAALPFVALKSQAKVLKASKDPAQTAKLKAFFKVL